MVRAVILGITINCSSAPATKKRGGLLNDFGPTMRQLAQEGKPCDIIVETTLDIHLKTTAICWER